MALLYAPLLYAGWALVYAGWGLLWLCYTPDGRCYGVSIAQMGTGGSEKVEKVVQIHSKDLK